MLRNMELPKSQEKVVKTNKQKQKHKAKVISKPVTCLLLPDCWFLCCLCIGPSRETVLMWLFLLLPDKDGGLPLCHSGSTFTAICGHYFPFCAVQK